MASASLVAFYEAYPNPETLSATIEDLKVRYSDPEFRGFVSAEIDEMIVMLQKLVVKTREFDELKRASREIQRQADENQLDMP